MPLQVLVAVPPLVEYVIRITVKRGNVAGPITFRLDPGLEMFLGRFFTNLERVIVP